MGCVVVNRRNAKRIQKNWPKGSRRKLGLVTPIGIGPSGTAVPSVQVWMDQPCHPTPQPPTKKRANQKGLEHALFAGAEVGTSHPPRSVQSPTRCFLLLFASATQIMAMAPIPKVRDPEGSTALVSSRFIGLLFCSWSSSRSVSVHAGSMWAKHEVWHPYHQHDPSAKLRLPRP